MRSKTPDQGSQTAPPRKAASNQRPHRKANTKIAQNLTGSVIGHGPSCGIDRNLRSTASSKIARENPYRRRRAAQSKPKFCEACAKTVAPIMRAIGKPATNGERAERSAQLLRAANVFGLPLKRGSEMTPTVDNAIRQ